VTDEQGITEDIARIRTCLEYPDSWSEDALHDFDRIVARVVSLTEALERARDCCARPVGVCIAADVGEGTPARGDLPEVSNHWHTDPTGTEPPPFNPDPNLAGYLFTNEKPKPE
jgi:hypothetical protein